MAPVKIKFATPVAHQTSDDYSAYDGRIRAGRPFRQPLETAPNPSGFVPGTEIFFTAGSAPALAKIYACFSGAIFWQPSVGSNAPGTIVLKIDRDPYRREIFRPERAKIKMVEAFPAELVYDDVSNIKMEIINLLTSAYEATRGVKNQLAWHPSMRQEVRSGSKKIFLKRFLDQEKDNAARAIEAIAEGFANPSLGGLLGEIRVNPGDIIGEAALKENGERRLLFKMIDPCAQVINPLYYFHIFFAQRLLATRVLESVTKIASSTSPFPLIHPLAMVFPELRAATPPLSRIEMDGKIFMPIGQFKNFHGFPYRSEETVSRLEWRYNDVGSYEQRDRPTPPRVAAPSTVPATDHITKTNNIWQRYGESISIICRELQVPCELVVSLIGTESLPNLNERIMRIEPLKNEVRGKLTNNATTKTLVEAYDKAVGRHGTIVKITSGQDSTTICEVLVDGLHTFAKDKLVNKFAKLVLWQGEAYQVAANSSGIKDTAINKTKLTVTLKGGQKESKDIWILNGTSESVPQPWNDNSPVTAGSPLTWSQLAAIVDVTKGINISPGLIQTLISTAQQQSVPFLESVTPEIFTRLSLPSPPARPSDYLKSWLLTGKASILAGVAKIRLGYNLMTNYPPTFFDLPLVGANYNAGSAIKKLNTNWGLVYYDAYVERAAPFFNAAVNKFNNSGLTPTPSVRFKL